jgi:hypothetical protein
LLQKGLYVKSYKSDVKGRRNESIHKSSGSSNTEPTTTGTTTTTTNTTTEESVGPFAIVDAPIKIVPFFYLKPLTMPPISAFSPTTDVSRHDAAVIIVPSGCLRNTQV